MRLHRSLPIVGLVAGVVFGVTLTMVATSACQPCGTEQPEPFYRAVEGIPEGWVVDTVFVEFDDDTAIVTYETVDGGSWEVEFHDD
jgi:hypothetical protein